MKLRFPFLVVAAALAVSPCRAQDGAPADASELKPPAADAPKAEAAPDGPAAPPAAAAPKKKAAAKGKAAKKSKPAAESKYKSRELADNTENAYRFDAQGNPVKPKGKAPAGAKKKASAPAASEEKPAEKAACGADESCADKKTSDDDSNAL